MPSGKMKTVMKEKKRVAYENKTVDYVYDLLIGALPDPGIKPVSPALPADTLPSESPGKPPNTGLVQDMNPKTT